MSDFFTSFRKQALSTALVEGDTVRIVGMDQYKGWIGTIARIQEISGQQLYSVELQATSQRIERYKDSLRKEYN